MTASDGAEVVGVRVLHCADGLALAEVGGHFVAIWRSGVTKPLFEWQRHCLVESLQRHPKGAAFMCVIEPTCKPPDDELRRASADMIAENENRLRCVAVVIEGDGFRAAIARSVLSGMVLLFPNRRVPVSYFSTVRDATEWVARHAPVQTTEGFVAGVSRVRARMSAWDND
jgi:hypothetical protein